jgi:TonB family protein
MAVESRRMSAGVGSLVIHGVLAALFVALAAPAPTTRPAPFAIDVVAPSAPAPTTIAAAMMTTIEPDRTPARRRGTRRVVHAPPAKVVAPPAPTIDPGGGGGSGSGSETGSGAGSGSGTGSGSGVGSGSGSGSGAGVGGGSGSGGGGGGARGGTVLRPSRARPARPKRDYRAWAFRAPDVYRGQTVLVELWIDATGRVVTSRVISGVSDDIDEHAIRAAREFEFYPALDRDGTPIGALYRWEFVLGDARN